MKQMLLKHGCLFAMLAAMVFLMPNASNAQFNPRGGSSFPSSPSSRGFPNSPSTQRGFPNTRSRSTPGFPNSQNFPRSNTRSRNMNSRFNSTPTFPSSPNRSPSTFPNTRSPSFPSSSSVPRRESWRRSSGYDSSSENKSTYRPRYGRLIGLGIKGVIVLIILLGGGGASWFAMSRGDDSDDTGHGHNQPGPTQPNSRNYNPYRDG